MPKPPAPRVAGASKWIPKGAQKEEPGEELSAGETEVVPMVEASAGPRYDRPLMLQCFRSVCGTTSEPRPAEEAALEQDSPGLSVSLSDRPAQKEPEETKKPGSRRALREQRRLEKIAKRAVGPGSDEEAPVAQQISLSQELPGYPQTPYEMALMTYLSRMYSAPPAMYGGSGLTTVMLRNIPNRYTRDMLIERLNQTYGGQFDFVYLPIDFNSKCNVGYAFINFRSPEACQSFYQEFHNAKTKSVLPGFTSSKVCEVSYARVQGRDANMDNLRDEKFVEKLNERPEWQPLFYDDSGKEIPFAKTLGTGRKRGRPGSSNSPAILASMMTPPPSFSLSSPYRGPMASPMTPFGPLPSQEIPILAMALPHATSYTMQMLRNIPTDCTRVQLAEKLNQSFSGSLDFLYMPQNESGGNRGFAFMNFKTRAKAQQFAKAFNGELPSKCLGISVSEDGEKPCEVTSARMQNLEKSLERLRRSVAADTPADWAAWCPVVFDSTGAEAPFPLAAQAPALPAVPSQALDSRALEKQMQAMQGSGPSAKAQDQDERKGKKKRTGKMPKSPAAGPSTPAQPGYGYGFQGFPSYPPGQGMGQGMPVDAAYAAHVQQLAHEHAKAAAAAHAAHAGLLGPLAAAVNPVHGAPLEEDQKKNLLKQIEFYFSAENLCRDLYLRSFMNSAGWTPLELIERFPKVRAYNANEKEIIELLQTSEVLEVDSVTRYTRLKDEAMREKFAKVPDEYRQTFVSHKKSPVKEKSTE
eukprot:CAMPEP_0170599526 /NCGR_PEP_ID=MMETSP0224-20130122/16846_1 /TAXON_ID=285029 /ORGANISM="Togula jolla, Strain CCCM 725" /LENGTH=751 /DNA_ID=CAMNT_0010924187 /DNA_START=96 /DNA_END=2351 /DNA_ORIENTATION=-